MTPEGTPVCRRVASMFPICVLVDLVALASRTGEHTQVPSISDPVLPKPGLLNLALGCPSRWPALEESVQAVLRHCSKARDKDKSLFGYACRRGLIRCEQC